jgi:hypothetical protein
MRALVMHAAHLSDQKVDRDLGIGRVFGFWVHLRSLSTNPSVRDE